MEKHLYRCKCATGNRVTALALVSSSAFSARYDLDRERGVISRQGHPLRGVEIGGRILVCRNVQGGVAAGWALLSLRCRGVGFVGLVFGDTNPAMVQGAVAAGIPVLSGVEDEIFSSVKNGDTLCLDPEMQTVEVVSSVVSS